MVRATLFALGVGLLLGSALQAQQDDPVKAKLDKAKAAYDERIDSLRAGLLKSFDDREETARKGGNKKLVDQIKAEREGFEARGELPKVVLTANYTRDTKQARTDLELAYAAAVREYVKAKKDDEAAAAERDLAAFKDTTGDAVLLSVQLAKGTVWVGNRRVATEKGKLAEDPIALRVTGRDGKAFKGVLTIDSNRKYEVEGQVDGDKIAFATDKKGKFKNTFEGRLRGKNIELTFAGTGIGGEQIRGLALVWLDKGK